MEDLRDTCYPLFQSKPEKCVLEQIIDCEHPTSNDQFYCVPLSEIELVCSFELRVLFVLITIFLEPSVCLFMLCSNASSLCVCPEDLHQELGNHHMTSNNKCTNKSPYDKPQTTLTTHNHHMTFNNKCTQQNKVMKKIDDKIFLKIFAEIFDKYSQISQMFPKNHLEALRIPKNSLRSLRISKFLK